MALRQLVIGMDLGGTKINTALVDRAGSMVARDFRETVASEGPDAVIARMVSSARQVMSDAGVGPGQIDAAGVCAPGPLDLDDGLVLSPPNLPGWVRVPLRERVAEALDMETLLENDASAAGLGENRFGAARGSRHMIYVTASTGIGGGLILDGKLYHGAAGMAGEIGHQTILPQGRVCPLCQYWLDNSAPEISVEYRSRGDRTMRFRDSLASVPDPVVVPKAKRRKFPGAYKRRILEEADNCTEPGQIGALLRQEGLYSSHLSTWRRQGERGALEALNPRKRGRKRKDELEREVAQLQRENEQLPARLEQAGIIIEVQEKLSSLLGVATEENGTGKRA